ncbi:MAG: enoyl-CoA hydratase-related protein [Pikeienuella sp.]
MAYEFLTTEREGNILIVTMNRPEVYNAVHVPMHQEMDAVWNDFAADPDLWVAVLTGAGDKAFCAGNDLKATAQGVNKGPMPASGFAGLANRLDREKPIIAAVNGFAMGGGLETAISCDIIIAADTARVAVPEVKVGFFAAAGGVQKLSRHIGRKAAMEMILTGRQVGAAEAKELGIVNQVVPQADVMDVAMAKAREIAGNSPSAIKSSMRVLAKMDEIEQTLESLHASGPELDWLKNTYDFSEGVNAFVEKRKPEWKNK